MTPNHSSSGKGPDFHGQLSDSTRKQARSRGTDLNEPGGETLEAQRMVGGRFRLEREVGRGGMGVVWLARDKTLEEAVALKFLPKDVGQDPVAVRELTAEAKVMRGLTHPNIVRLHDIRFSQGRAFLVQAYMAGGSLAEFLASVPDAALSLEETMWVLREVAPAIGYAHSQGITHRDIKPANLLLSKGTLDYLGGNGESLRVADFGLAFTAREALSRTSGYRPSGTLGFMAPEILLGKRPTPAADIYSLAATVFCLVTGQPPFARGEIAAQALTKIAPELDSGRPALDQAVAMALRKNPNERPSSVEEFMRIAEGSVRLPAPAARVVLAEANPWRSPWALLAAGALLMGGAYLTRHRWMGAEKSVLAEGEPSEERLTEDVAAGVDVPTAEVRSEELAHGSQPQSSPVQSSVTEVSPAETRALRKLSRYADRVDEAKGLKQVGVAFGEALADGLEGRCDKLCEIAVPRVRSLLEEAGGAGEPTLAKALERLEQLEDITALHRCGELDPWRDLAKEELGLAELVPLSAVQDFESAAVSLDAVLAHSGDGHRCLGDLQIEELREANKQAMRGQLKAAMGRDDLGFLTLLRRLEGYGDEFPHSTLRDATIRIMAIGPGTSEDVDRRKVREVAAYLKDREDAPEAERITEALDRLMGGLLERVLQGAKEAKAKQRAKVLFAGMDGLDPLMLAADYGGGGALQAFPQRAGELFEGSKRAFDLIRSSYEFLNTRPESFFRASVNELLEHADRQLAKKVPEKIKGNYSLKDYRDLLDPANELYLIEGEYSDLQLGERGKPISVYRRQRDAVWSLVQTQVDNACDTINGAKRGSLRNAAETLDEIERALSEKEAFHREHAAILGTSPKAQYEHAMFVTKKFRNSKSIPKRLFDTKEFRTAVRSSKTWLGVASDGNRGLGKDYEVLAYQQLILSLFRFSETYYMYCDRIAHAKHKGHQSYIKAPERQLKDGMECLDEAASYYAEYLSKHPREAMGSGLGPMINDLRGEFNRLKSI